MSHETLTRLVRRLEAATSRLEDMTHDALEPRSQPNGIPAIPGGPPRSAVTEDARTDEPGGTSPPPKAMAQPLPPSIDDFDGLMNGDVKAFVNMSDELGGALAEQVCSLTQVTGWVDC